MSATEQATDAEADETNEEREAYVWGQQQPITRLKFSVDELLYSGDLDSDVAQNSTSFGLRGTGLNVIRGNLFENDERVENGFENTAEAADENDQPRATDFRIADVDDESTNAKGDFLFTGEKMGDYTLVDNDAGADEEVILWYNGMSGQMVGRTLDFNGSPFARFVQNDDGSSYLIKGLLQVVDEWRSDGGRTRSALANDDKAPRVARTPILRSDVDEVIIDLSRYNGGRLYEVHIFDAADVENPDADIEFTDSGAVLDGVEELRPRYESEADDILDSTDTEIRWAMHFGGDWGEEPSDSELRGSTDVTLDVNADEEGEDGFTTAQRNLIDSFEDALKGSGHTPDSAFDGGLDGALPKYADAVGGEENLPDTDEVRRELYKRLSHLDVGELEE